MKRVLIIIDLQKQFADKNKINYSKCLTYISDNENKYDYIIATIFKQDKNNTNYINHLGWDGCMDSSLNDLEFNTFNKKIIYKNNYGSFDSNFLQNILMLNTDDNIDIIGCDSDACVLASCFSLWDNGYTNFHILKDYVYTTSNKFDNDTVLEIMRRNFGNCVI